MRDTLTQTALAPTRCQLAPLLKVANNGKP